MKRKKSRTIAMNPLANATGKQYTGTGKEFTLDTSKLSFAKLRQLAIPTEVKLQLQKIEMPLLPDMKYIGHAGYAEYHAMGKALADYIRGKDSIPETKKWLRKKIVTTRVFTFNQNNSWRIFSRDYYPQKITNLYKNINDWFELQFRAKVQDIANTQDKTEKAKKEQELKKYLVEDFLEDQIGTILTEAEANKEEVMKCIESFVLNPQIVLNHQFKYFNTLTGQENTYIAREIKKGIKDNITGRGRHAAINGTNELSNDLNSYNKKIYENALKALPEISFLQATNDNIDAAFKYIDSFDSTEVSNAQTDNYTDRLGAHNIPNKDLGGKKKKSDLGIILAGAGILAVIVYLKKRN